MAQVADVRVKVRATRAYLAGFGTSGSLLAGAALMFVLASAIVAFRGWPQIVGQTPITSVSVAHVSVAPSSSTGRILNAPGASHYLYAALHPGAGTVTTGGGAVNATAVGGGAVSATRVQTTASRPAAGGRGNLTAVLPALPPVCAGSLCVSQISPPSVDGVTSVAGQALTSVGQQAGTAVTTATSSAANSLAPVSQSVSSTVKSVGKSAGGGVTHTASGLGAAVTGGIHLSGSHLSAGLKRH